MLVYIIILLNTAMSLIANAKTANEAFVFRIADNWSYEKEGDLGHCSGFLFNDQLYTAAHCNHFQPFMLVNQKGKVFLDLKSDEKFYLKNSFGLLDVVTIKLDSAQVKVIQDSAEKIVLSPKGVQIIGYPIYRREMPATIFDCDFFSNKKLNFRHQLERSIDVIHHSCNQANYLNKIEINALTHADVKGLSGGLLVVDGNIKGVVFHYDEPRGDLLTGVYKSIILNEEQQLVSEQIAIPTYQLGKKLFEEIKQPNKSIMALELFLSTELMLKNGYLTFIQSILPTNDKWRVEFLDGTSFEFEDSKMPESIRKLLISMNK